MAEIWKKIKGAQWYYEVSDKGRIRSIERTINDSKGVERKMKGKTLKLSDRGTGYLRVDIRQEDGSFKNCDIHRIVAETFLLNPKNKSDVNHKDGNTYNNELNNLEWNTKSENHLHAYKCLNRKSPVSKEVINVKTGKIYESVAELYRSASFHFSQNHLYNMLLGHKVNITNYQYLNN